MDRSPSGRTAAAAVLLTLSIAGCGGSERDETRERVDAYVKSEQEVMQRAQPEFQRANESYLAYARGELEPDAAAKDAAEAERSIRRARDGLTVLDPPADAKPLHDGLVRYLQMNVEIARETTLLARYVPAVERALRPLGRANRQLQSGLAGARRSTAQARALRRFAAAVAGTLAALRKLEAPVVLQPAHGDQIRRLDVTRRLAGRLRRALHAQDAERVARLLKRFRRTTTGRGPSRLLADQALAQYTRRLQQLNDAYADVQREQLKLDRRLR